ncbi:MAG: SulP family inorganic anion transporter [Rhodospirillales bacterium]
MQSPGLTDDIRGAVSGAAAILPAVLSSGIVLFAPLGGGWLASGIAAAVVAAVVGNLALALAGGSAFHLTCPKTAVAAVLAGAAAALLQAPGTIRPEIVALAIFAAVILSGMIEFLLGATGLGRFVKFVPQPVIAGFLNGLAILVVVSQLPAFLGIAGGMNDLLDHPQAVLPGAALLGIVTILAMLASRAWFPRLPAPLVGLAFGSLAWHVTAWLLPGTAFGSVIGGAGALMLAAPLLPAAAGEILSGPVPPVVLATALSLAVINSIQTLLSAAAIDTDTGARHDSGRELRAQGGSHIISGLLGGMTSSGTVPYTRAAAAAGGGSRRSAIFCALILAAVGIAAGPIAGHLPQPVVAGMILVIALAVVDRWTGQLVRGWIKSTDPAIRREIGASLAIVTIVTLLVALGDLVIGVGTGLALSLLAHLQTASRTVVHRVHSGASARSRVGRPMRELKRLETEGAAIRILALQGPLFFGATDSLISAVESNIEGAGILIVDLRRVTSIDSSGAAALAQIDRRLARDNVTLLLAGLDETRSGRALIREAGHTAFEDEHRLFADFDSALAAAEEILLAGEGESPGELPLGALDMFAGLDAAAVETLAGKLHRESYGAGEKLIVEGEASDAIYILAAGRASVIKSLPDGRFIRLATYLPGVVLGEMGVLGDTSRTADIVIDEDAVCYRLTAQDFEAICRDEPALALELVRGLSRELSRRLAATSATLREMER